MKLNEVEAWAQSEQLLFRRGQFPPPNDILVGAGGAYYDIWESNGAPRGRLVGLYGAYEMGWHAPGWRPDGTIEDPLPVWSPGEQPPLPGSTEPGGGEEPGPVIPPGPVPESGTEFATRLLNWTRAMELWIKAVEARLRFLETAPGQHARVSALEDAVEIMQLQLEAFEGWVLGFSEVVDVERPAPE